MAAGNPEDAAGEIKARIGSILQSQLTDKPAILMSEFGTLLGPDLARLKSLTPRRKLTDFISQEFSGLYKVVTVPGLEATYAIASAALGDDKLAKLTLEDIKPKRQRATGPRLLSAFRSAFSRPLEMGRRFINLESVTFSDFTGEPPVGDEWLEVTAKVIAPSNVEDRTELINESIETWLRDHDLTIDRFLIGGSETQFPRAKKRNLLQELIGALDDDQLRTTSLSLDVVKRLLSRNVDV